MNLTTKDGSKPQCENKSYYKKIQAAARDFGLEKDFLGKTEKAHFIKGKTDEPDIKTLNFCVT